MKNYVELAKKSLADDDSVTLEELKANARAAHDAYWAAWAAKVEAETDWYAYWAAELAYWAAWDAETDAAARVEYFKQQAIKAVKEYEELTK